MKVLPHLNTKMKAVIIFFLAIHVTGGWEILTATLDPPIYPILEGEDVIAKVSLLDFEIVVVEAAY